MKMTKLFTPSSNKVSVAVLILALSQLGLLASTDATAITLQEAVRRAVENNLGVQILRYEPANALDWVEIEEAAFDVELFSNASHVSRETTSTFSATQGTSIDRRYYEAGARKLLSTGGTLSASTSLARSDSNAGTNFTNLEYGSEFGVDLRQPLLRGAWKSVNLAAVAKARSQYTQERHLFQNELAYLVEQTEIAYWTLAYARTRLELQESIRKAAASLVDETKEREEVGLATRVEVLQAEAALASREEAIILVEQFIAEAEDNLGRMMGLLEAPEAGATFAALDLNVESIQQEAPEIPDFTTTWTNTLAWNPLIAAQEEIIYRTDIDKTVARNQLLPQVDITLGASLLGNDNIRARNAISNAADRDGEEWRIGLEVIYPWGRNEARAYSRIAERTLERENIRLQETKSALYREVRLAWRELANAPTRLKAVDASVRLQEQNHAQFLAHYQSGLSTLREVIEAQGDLDTAQIDRLEAILSILQAKARLGRLDGSGLTRNGLLWDDTAPLVNEF